LLFIYFNRTLRSSTSIEDIHNRYPSAPNLLQDDDAPKSSGSTHQPPFASNVRRSSCLPKLRGRIPPALLRQAASIDCSSPPLSLQQHFPFSSSTQYVDSKLNSSNNTLQFRSELLQRAASGSMCSQGETGPSRCTSSRESLTSPKSQLAPSSFSNTEIGSSSVSNSRATTGGSSSGATCGSSTVRFSPGTVDLHLPNGKVTLRVVNSIGESSRSRQIQRCHSEDVHFDSSSNGERSDTLSPLHHNYSKLFMKSMDATGRPTLMRQQKIERTEIICIPDSDDENRDCDDTIPEEKDEESE